ncbi:retention module-containing protein, partial [Crenobacter caeni]
MAQGKVVAIQGVVRAIAADGSVRILKAGDMVATGERIELANGASLTFERPGGQQVSLDGGRTVLLAEETLQPNAVDATEARVAPLSAEAEKVIAALNSNEDPLGVLEETAAGLTGGSGADGGHGFVRLGRIVETLNELNLETARVDARVVPEADGQVATAAREDAPVDTTAPTISVDAPDNSNDTTPTITGKTDAPAGSTVTIVVTDAKGDKQTLTTTVKPDGSYSVDVSKPLPEGGYKVDASVKDPTGNTGTASDSGNVDVTAPIITVNAPDNSNDTTPTITGKTDAPAGSTVTIVVTDAKGDKQMLTTTVKPDGSYSVDVSKPLPEGGYKADASVSDPAGNKGQASDNGNVDVTAPKITVEIVNDANNDGWLNGKEAGDGHAQVEVRVDHAALQSGGQVSLTIDRAGSPDARVVTVKFVDGTVQFTDAQGKVLMGYAYDQGVIRFNEGVLAEGEQLKVDAVQTDAAGNKGAGSDSAQLGSFGTTDSGAVTEDAAIPTLSDSGQLKVATEIAFKAGAGVAQGEVLGSLTITADGTWTYNVDNSKVQYLGAGATRTESFKVQSVDGTEHMVTITINGTDDAPVISRGTGSVVEDSQPSIGGQLTASDADNADLAFVGETVKGNYGSLVLGSDGQWTYTLDSR